MVSCSSKSWMSAVTVFLVMLCSTTQFVVADLQQEIKETEKEVEALKEGQDFNRLMVLALQDSITEKLNKAIEKKRIQEELESEETDDAGVEDLKVKEYLERLRVVESNIESIENYVSDEKATDEFLTALRGETGQKFDGNMAEVKRLATGMKDELKNYFVDVDHDLTEVEDFANSRNVIIGGVLYYGGIGSACESGQYVCRLENSECRDGKCQCLSGYSHDSLQQSCVKSCDKGYGKTYQSVENYIIRGHNDFHMNETNLDECKERCETKATFVCRTIDYFPRWKSCYLSQHTKDEVDGWEYNSAGIHFQRDCIIDKE